MKKIIIIIALLLFPGLCLADFDATKWPYYKDIVGEVNNLGQFIIDDEVFANAAWDLRDLRIIDASGRETPYKMVTSRAQSNYRTYSPKILNSSYLAGEDSYAIIDFGANPPEVNKLTINTSASNFQRNVRIEGSNELGNWRTIKENVYIYDYTDTRAGVNTKNTSLSFPASIFRYLRVVIADDGSEPVRISSISSYMQEKTTAKERERSPKYTISENTKTKSTEIIIDLESRGIPTKTVKLNVVDANFNRSVSIYGSYNQENWRSLGSAYVFRYNTPKFIGENLELNFSETNDRYIKLVISNKDNLPIRVTDVKTYSTYREVIFTAIQGNTYVLYYGNNKARYPEYDLEKYFQYLDVNQAQTAALSEEKNNSEFIQEKKTVKIQKSETTPYLITIALLFSVLIMVYLVYRFFKKG